MMESDDDLLAIWCTTSAEVPADRSACLTEVEWARLLTKEPDAEVRARAADHIASCRECAEEYRLLQPLRLWAADVEQVFPSKDWLEPTARCVGAGGGCGLARHWLQLAP